LHGLYCKIYVQCSLMFHTLLYIYI
jgi:hypothetical protein